LSRGGTGGSSLRATTQKLNGYTTKPFLFALTPCCTQTGLLVSGPDGTRKNWRACSRGLYDSLHVAWVRSFLNSPP
jgi:hypothetical protein